MQYAHHWKFKLCVRVCVILGNTTWSEKNWKKTEGVESKCHIFAFSMSCDFKITILHNPTSHWHTMHIFWSRKMNTTWSKEWELNEIYEMDTEQNVKWNKMRWAWFGTMHFSIKHVFWVIITIHWYLFFSSEKIFNYKSSDWNIINCPDVSLAQTLHYRSLLFCKYLLYIKIFL